MIETGVTSEQEREREGRKLDDRARRQGMGIEKEQTQEAEEEWKGKEFLLGEEVG